MKSAVQKTVGVLAAEAVETYLQKAESYEKVVLKDEDPENLHQMRVNLRRLRTVMQVFSPSIRLPKAGRESQVAHVAQRLGQLRDLDVITATLREQYAPDLPEYEGRKLTKILADLSKRRKKAYKQVKSTLRGDRYKKLKASLHKWSRLPNCNATARLNINTVLPDLTLPLVGHLWLHPGWLIGVKTAKGKLVPDHQLNTEAVNSLVEERSKAVHSLRKQVKRVRYQLKFVSEYYGDRLNTDLTRLADLQDALGALQDSLVMASFLHKASSDWQTDLPTLKSLLMDSRYRAWQQWQSLQQHYLDEQNRDALRRILLTPGEETPSPAASQTKASKPTEKSVTAGRKSATRSSSRTRPSKPTSRRSSTSSSKKSQSPKRSPEADQNGASE